MSFPKELLDHLHIAVDLHDNKTVRKILSKSSELLDHPNRCSVVELLLLKALNCDDEYIVANLVNFLKTEAKINLERYLGQAIINGDLRLAEFLLGYGARIRSKEWIQNLAAQHTFCRAHINTRRRMLALLMRYGLSPTYRNDNHENLLHIFSDHVTKDDTDAAEIAKILLDFGVSLHDRDDRGLSPLILSIKTQNIRFISYLIQRGAFVNEKCGEYDVFPLYKAVMYDNKELVNFLLSRGAEINARSQNDWTALHVACYFHHKSIIKILIESGADAKLEDKSGRTPFSLLDNKIMQLVDV